MTSEYTANLDDVREAYVWDKTRNPEEMERRGRAFDRLVRQIQDEAFEDGENQARWEFEDD